MGFKASPALQNVEILSRNLSKMTTTGTLSKAAASSFALSFAPSSLSSRTIRTVRRHVPMKRSCYATIVTRSQHFANTNIVAGPALLWQIKVAGQVNRQAPGQSRALKGGNKRYAPRQMTLMTRYDPAQVPNVAAVDPQISQFQTVLAPNDLANGQKPWVPFFNNQHLNSTASRMTDAFSGNYGYGPSGESVYVVDRNGSEIHFTTEPPREHGNIASNSNPLCIMCLAMPRREQDHFCSNACKEESMKSSSSVEISNPVDYEDY